ncbi:MAG: hypothetical protein PVJ34_21280, partial [Anaerolineae bacterium]
MTEGNEQGRQAAGAGAWIWLGVVFLALVGAVVAGGSLAQAGEPVAAAPTQAPAADTMAPGADATAPLTNTFSFLPLM